MKSKKVLIVDHNDLNRKLFESLIGQVYSFVAVQNGLEAISKASSEKFDLILMDIQMPEMDGITASKIIRKQSAYQCPIIATTAFSTEASRDCFLKLGFDDLITKPIRPREFLDLISNNIKVDSVKQHTLTEEAEKSDILDKAVFNQLLKYNSSKTIKSIYFDFLEELDQLIISIDAAYQEKNQQTLLENLHTLKGNSGTLGAQAIYGTAGDADMKARSQDWYSLEIVLEKLKNERIIFENYLREETTFSK
jgi:CheY-like chemotaxis protein